MKTEAKQSLKIEHVTDIQGIESIRDAWATLFDSQKQPAINAHIDRYLSVMKTLPPETSPCVLAVKNGDQIETLAIGRIEKKKISASIGYLTVLKPALKCLTIIYGGILGKQNEQTCHTVIQKLRNMLKSGEINTVYFNHLAINSSFYKAIRKQFGPFCRSVFDTPEKHWIMTIPKSMDDFYAARSSKHRKHLKQYQRKLDKDFDGNVNMITYSQPDQLDKAIRDAAAVSQKTYQHGMGCGFNDSPKIRTLLQTAAQNDWFRGHILYVDKKPAAYRFALQYGQTYFANGIGYDPTYRKYRVGTVLFLKVLQTLCENNDVQFYDFGFGDAEYKTSYADTTHSEASIYLFATRPHPMLVNSLCTVIMAVDRGLSWIAQKTGLANIIKRRWRHKLAKQK